jgi:hypothetical protein
VAGSVELSQFVPFSGVFAFGEQISPPARADVVVGEMIRFVSYSWVAVAVLL